MHRVSWCAMAARCDASASQCSLFSTFQAYFAKRLDNFSAAESAGRNLAQEPIYIPLLSNIKLRRTQQTARSRNMDDADSLVCACIADGVRNGHHAGGDQICRKTPLFGDPRAELVLLSAGNLQIRRLRGC